MALWPFIITKLPRRELGHTLINHERIHGRQQLECLILFFYLLYFGEFLFHLVRGLNSRDAYMAISFEKEAYGHEAEPDYLKKRKPYANFRLWGN